MIVRDEHVLGALFACLATMALVDINETTVMISANVPFNALDPVIAALQVL